MKMVSYLFPNIIGVSMVFNAFILNKAYPIQEELIMEELIVSISCKTYNHEDYIADAIDGFLQQKTNFKYEILIHDDASTDRTADIIRAYEKKYPDLIKPIYQTVNQYSIEGVSVTQLNLSRAKGKYIAECEGDDYWIDPYKLQKQYGTTS